MKKFLVCNWKRIVALSITIIIVYMSITYFPYAFARLWESIIDFIASIKYYFNSFFTDTKDLTVTINNVSKAPFDLPFYFPKTIEDLSFAWDNFWTLFWDSENFNIFLTYFSFYLYYFVLALNLLLPFVILFVVYIKHLLSNENNNFNKDSKPLILWKKFENKVYSRIKNTIKSFFDFLREERFYRILWIVIAVYSFNFISIVIEFFAYYLYLISSFDFTTIFIQIYKLLCDIGPVINFFPGIVWFCILCYVFNKIRKRIGYKRLRHWEMKNRGFINSLPIVVMGCGTMGSKKTTMITDMGLSQEVMFRHKAFEKILEIDLKFPNFPWINLENVLKRLLDIHIIYNLATVKGFIKNLSIRYEQFNPIERKSYRRYLKKTFGIDIGNGLFDYDYKKYGLYYDDKLKLNYIWDVLEDYSQLYFIYIIQSSLLISNYSIRTDNLIADLGNFPLWDTDFFERDSRLMDSYSRHSHILDFDSLRLGKKVIENNPYQDSFEFGIVLITEVGKERGNTLELSEKKKTSVETNQKNDLFDSELKMVRHSATVDNTPFVRIFTDEQRPESWGANARDLCNILNMEQSSDLACAMPFFDFADILYMLTHRWFERIYSTYRYSRGDNLLSMYLIKGLFSKFHKYYKSIYNTFGYMDMSITLERGTQDGEIKSVNYKLMVKKIYSKRFSTDCHSGFFNKKALRSDYGINDLPEYKTVKASFDELNKQNSYFIKDLMSGLSEFEEK